MAQTTSTHYRNCPLCEATCGLSITLSGDKVTGIRGDDDDVFSRGFICPKGYAVKELDADPDRVRTPLIKRNGRFESVSWDDEDVRRSLRRTLSCRDEEKNPRSGQTQPVSTDHQAT